MTSKIFRSTVFVAVVVLLSGLGVVMGVLYSHFSGVQVRQLKDELSLAVTGTEQYGNAFLENVEVDRFRITWIDTDGTVLFDTRVDQTAMENHADREEIREALELIRGADALFYGVDRAMDAAVRRGAGAAEREALASGGAQAEAMGLYFDAKGSAVCGRTTSVLSLQDMARCTCAAIAVGRSRAEAVLAVCLHHPHRLLVIDEGAALKMIELLRV